MILSAVLALAFISVANSASCPSGFSHYYSHGSPSSSHSYYPSCYKFVRSMDTWQGARVKCQACGADLVSIESSGEQHHLDNIIRAYSYLKYPSSSPNARLWGYWTSGTDEQSEGRWTWAATGRSIGYKKWARGEPNNSFYIKEQPENCLLLYRRANYYWNDLECNYPFASFICEKRGK